MKRYLAALTTDRMIRAAVVLTVVGLVLLLPILLGVSAFGMGLFMLGSLLISVSIALYLGAVIQELRRTRAL
jgi:hypothetical protein